MSKPVHIFEAHGNYVFDLKFTKDGKTLISIGMDNVIKLWSVPDWKHIKTIEGHEKSVNSIALSPDEKRIVTGSTDNSVKIWSFPEGECLHTLVDRNKVVSSVDISPDGQYVGMASYSGRTAVWTMDGDPVFAVKANEKNLGPVRFSPDGLTMATGGLGGEIKIWGVPSGDQLATLTGHEIVSGGIIFLEGGAKLVSYGYEQLIRVWDLKSNGTIRILEPQTKGIRGMLVSADEETVVLSTEGNIEFYDLESWEVTREIPVSTKAVNGIAFSPDGKWFLAGAADKKIRVWEV